MGLRGALVLLGAAAAVAGCGSTTPTTVGGGGGSGTPAQAAQAPRVAAHAFAIFRRPARKGDEIPTDQANGGVKPAVSRLAYSGRLGMFYVYVHGGLICLSYATLVSATGAGSASGSCAAAPEAGATGVAAPVAASFDRLDRLALLLPDGVRTVRIVRAGAPPVTVQVAGNAVVYAGLGLRAWTYTTRDGMHESGALPRPVVPSPGHP
jgi:hypothetical protein